MSAAHAKKRLGQNFLKSDAVINRIVELVHPGKGDRIIEVGPGRGALTRALAVSGASVVAVEFDRDMMGDLNDLSRTYPNLSVINQDFLTYEPELSNYKLVGNLPYNITSPVIEWTARHHDAVRGAWFMVQKEVAARLASSPGSKDWAPIAIFTQLRFDIKCCFDVGPEHFVPSPKVVSSVIELLPRKMIEIEHYELFEKVVRVSFQQRRKTLFNNLVPGLISDADKAREIWDRMQLGAKSRAEELTTAQFLELTGLLVAHKIL